MGKLTASPGRLERREFEYRKHGTASIVAALDVHPGQVLVEDITRNDPAAFCDCWTTASTLP